MAVGSPCRSHRHRREPHRLRSRRQQPRKLLEKLPGLRLRRRRIHPKTKNSHQNRRPILVSNQRNLYRRYLLPSLRKRNRPVLQPHHRILIRRTKINRKLAIQTTGWHQITPKPGDAAPHCAIPVRLKFTPFFKKSSNNSAYSSKHSSPACSPAPEKSQSHPPPPSASSPEKTED